jgi:integrase
MGAFRPDPRHSKSEEIKGIKSPLAGLRFHDLRHCAITNLAESQDSDQTIMSIAGHVSQTSAAG